MAGLVHLTKIEVAVSQNSFRLMVNFVQLTVNVLRTVVVLGIYSRYVLFHARCSRAQLRKNYCPQAGPCRGLQMAECFSLTTIPEERHG